MNPKPTFPGILGREFARVDKSTRALRPGSVPGVLVSRTTRGIGLKPIRQAAPAVRPTLVMVVKELRNALLCVRGRDLGDAQGNGIPQLGARPLDTAAFLVAKPLALRQDVGVASGEVEYLSDSEPQRAFRRRRGRYPELMAHEVVDMSGLVTVLNNDLYDYSTNTQPESGSNWVPPVFQGSPQRWITEEIDPPYLESRLPQHTGAAMYSSGLFLHVLPVAATHLRTVPTDQWVEVTGEEAALLTIDFTDYPDPTLYSVDVAPPIQVVEVLGKKQARARYLDMNTDARRWRDLHLNQLAIDNLNGMGFYRTQKQEP